MKPNFLNNAFTPAQARAIEKFVASFVADVLKDYEAGPVENSKPGVVDRAVKPKALAKEVQTEAVPKLNDKQKDVE